MVKFAASRPPSPKDGLTFFFLLLWDFYLLRKRVGERKNGEKPKQILFISNGM